jgi:hypothetical protein
VLHNEQVGVAATERFHDLVKQGTPPSIFKGFFDLYIDGVTLEVSLIFKEFAEIGRANRKRLAVDHLEWAEAQTKHLIRYHIHLIPMWVREVCDKQVYDPDDDVDEQIYWRKWRAPNFLVMRPSRNQPYDIRTAWDRVDAEASSQWLELFTEHYVLHLESQVRKAAGAAAIELAKRPETVDSEELKGSTTPNVTSLAVSVRPASGSPRRELRQLETQKRYKRWQKEYRELKKRRPDMSDVWYSQHIARLAIAEGHSADTIRKHMTK